MSKTDNILSISNLTVKYRDNLVLEKVSFNVSKNEWFMLVGPNGAGKSTCIKAIAKTIDYDGQIRFFDTSIDSLESIDYAKKVGFLSQSNFIAYDFTVKEIVEMGRYCYRNGLFSKLDNKDKKSIEQALELTGLSDLQNRNVYELSGGEIQRVFLAQVFTQDPQLLILDEPVNNLDLEYQDQIFKLLKIWIKEKDKTVISVVHDLVLAKYYGTYAALLNKGKLIDAGVIDKVLSKDNLTSAYNIDVSKYMKNIYQSWK